MVVDIGEVKRHIKPKADSTLRNMRKDDLIEYIRCLENNYNVAVSFNENQAKYIESLDVEPVVHAFWEIYNEDSDDYWKRGWRCSHCKGYHFHNGGMIKKYKRCPNCGAHMDLKEADHG